MDMAAEMPPTVKIHGTDIAGNRFPTSHPDNVSFSVCSVLSLPQEWTGRFDYIHQRLLMGALKREEWPVAIAAMWRTVKPGGWVQLGEFAFRDYDIGPATDAWCAIHSQLYRRNDLVYRIFAEIPDLLREVGFRDVHVECRGYPIGGEKGKAGRFSLLEYYRGVKPKVVELGLLKSDQEAEESLLAMEKELESVDDAEIALAYTWAQKPLKA